MQSLFLTYYQRILLWNIVGNHVAPNLSETDVYLRLVGKLRLSDEEVIASGYATNGQQMSWKLPVAGYGDKSIELENTEAVALATAIEENKLGTRISDAEWMKPIVQKFKPAETELQPEVLPKGRVQANGYDDQSQPALSK
jgi:hypothetical protein